MEGDGRFNLGSDWDVIHIGAAVEQISDELMMALKNGGRMVLPVGDSLGQDFVVVDKDLNGKITKKKMLGVIYVPLTSYEKQVAR